MRRFFFLVVSLLLFVSCSPLNTEVILSPVSTQQPLSSSTKISEESLIATEQAKAAAVKTEFALTRAAQPTFTPLPTFTPISAHLPTFTPIANSTPAGMGAYFQVPSDVVGSRYEIENACYFDTQSGWERYEIYAGAIAGSGDDYSAQGVVVVRAFRMMDRDGEPVAELVETKEHMTLSKEGPLRLPSWGNCADDYMLLTTPLNFGWFLYPGSEEFYPYHGFPPLARLEVGEKTQVANLGSYCWGGGCLDGPGVSTSSVPLTIQSSSVARLLLPLDEIPAGLALFAMLASPPGNLQYDYFHGDSAEWSYEKPGRERLELGTLPLKKEQDIKLSLEPGYYVLTIFATWREHGDVTYGFLVDVRE